MVETLDALLNRCTVRLLDTGSSEQGTGFFIAPGQVLTCAHVVKDAITHGTLVQVFWRAEPEAAFLEASVVVSASDSGADLALLHLEENWAHPCAWLADGVNLLQDLYCFGYPARLAPKGIPVILRVEGHTEDEGQTLLTAKEGQIEPGMSGAPVLNLATGRVCGVMAWTKDATSALGGRAVLTRTIFQVFPTLQTAQMSWQKQDERWRAAQRATLRTLPGPSEGKIWHVPVHHTAFFTGREVILEQLHNTLTKDKHAVLTQAITGLGGIGKTQTALTYVHRYQHEYQAILWAQAESREELINSILTLAQVLDLPERTANEQDRVVEAFRRWLETHIGWLLVLDNVEALPTLQAVLPTNGQGHVLVTTRSSAVGPLGHPLALDVLTTAEAALLLLRRAKVLPLAARMDDAPTSAQVQAVAISELLGGLPLALDQAGAYIEETGCTLAEYLALFQQAHGMLLQQRGMLVTDHPASATVTFRLAFAQVEKTSPAAADLLRLCAYLAPEAIPEDIFTQGATDLPPAFQAVVTTPGGWLEVVRVVRGYSFLVRQGEPPTLSIHRLVQAVLREELDEADQRQWAERMVRLVNRAFPDPEFANWELCQQLLPHALMGVGLIESWTFDSLEAARLLHHTGYYLHERGQYEQALPLYQRALTLSEQILGPDHPQVAATLNNLAELYKTLGQYEQALPLYQRVLTINKQAFGPDKPEVAVTLNNLAGLYYYQGQYEQALPLLQRALAINEQAFGPNHPHVASILNSLGMIYQDKGQYVQALPLFKRALAIRKQVLGPDHPEVATSLNNLAGLYLTWQQYEQALPFLQEALENIEKAMGPDHPDVAFCLNSLAGYYYDRGQYEAALPLFERALGLNEQAFGPNHHQVAISLSNLAAIYRAWGQYEKALPLLQRALDINEQALGPHHSLVATSLNNLAGLYLLQKQYEQALPPLQRSVAIWEQQGELNHPHVAAGLSNLAQCYRDQGQYKRALPLYQQALRIDEQAYGADHPVVAKDLGNLADLFYQMGRENQARPLEARARAIRTKSSQPS